MRYPLRKLPTDCAANQFRALKVSLEGQVADNRIHAVRAFFHFDPRPERPGAMMQA